MTALARQNGWDGFETAGTKVSGGYEYVCDGKPGGLGCGNTIKTTRRYSVVGRKKTSGWLVCYGLCFPDEKADDEYGHDLDVVLAFCPSCAAIVLEQEKSK
jgi:hypothetical protein